MSPVAARPPGPPPRRTLRDKIPYYWGFATDPLGFVGDRFERYGDLYYSETPDGGLYVTRSPEHVREILVTRSSSFSKQHSAFKQLSQFLGAGLLTSDGETWSRQRRMVAPAFSPTRLAGYAEVMTAETARTADGLRAGEIVDLGNVMMGLTLRVVSSALFGHDAGDDVETVARSMNVFQRWSASASLIPAPIRRNILGKATSDLDAIMNKMIARRSAQPAASGTQDLLGLLLAARDVEGDGQGLTAREVRDQLVTLFLAGHETTSHALTWTLILLAQHPEIEVALYDEVRRALGGRREATYDDLPNMPLTERVVKESMRLYPPVYSVARRAEEDTEIGGHHVPRGSEVMVWIYFLQRDPRSFSRPDEFRPGRFVPEEEAKIPRFAYLPFGAGPRACIGRTFAMVEARLLLATLLARFRFDLAGREDVEAQPKITLVPKTRVKMRLRARA